MLKAGAVRKPLGGRPGGGAGLLNTRSGPGHAAPARAAGGRAGPARVHLNYLDFNVASLVNFRSGLFSKKHLILYFVLFGYNTYRNDHLSH
jgi:hypothetical protein